MNKLPCRFCKTPLEHLFISLGNAPLSNAFLSKEMLQEPEAFYPLVIYVCHQCFLVQINEYKRHEEIFDNNYIYFSSYSKMWLEHCKSYVEEMLKRYPLDQNAQVIEIASNDGYLLGYFKEKGIPVLGIEPASNTARAAKEKGIETIEEFFGVALAKRLCASERKADLLIGNNVLAHVPDLHDFVGGMKLLLKKKGMITLEFPHLMQLLMQHQVDTIYHEHFSYFSLYTTRQIFQAHGLEIFDVEEITTHGGSLRLYVKHQEDPRQISEAVGQLLKREMGFGIDRLNVYQGFHKKVEPIKYQLLKFLIEQKEKGNRVVGYGAAARGNTLLNYCGIREDLLKFVVDASPYKQGKFLPGSHIPVVEERAIRETKPDYILILPWNIQQEIIQQLNYVREWGAHFVVPIPRLQVL